MLRRPTFVLSAGAIVVVIASLLERWLPSGAIGRTFDVNSEQNVPTWYSAGLLLLAALSCGLAGALASPTGLRTRWWVVALLMLALSLDEVVGLHEELGDLGDDLVSPRGWLHFAWVVPGAIGGVIVVLAVVDLARRLPRAAARWLLLGLVLFLGGAFGGEMLSGAVLDWYGDADLYGVVTAAEELAEMLGAVAIIQAASTVITRTRTTDGVELRYAG